MFDTRCRELAEVFLEATRADDDDVKRLAQHIQDAIEAWLADFEAIRNSRIANIR